MIIIKDDSILNSKESIIVNNTTINGRMDSKISMDLRNKYQSLFKDYFILYQQYKSDNKQLLGLCQLIKVDENKYVANLFTQKFYSRHYKKTNYNAFIKAFTRLLNISKGDIAIPYSIACKKNSITWDKLLNIIELLSKDFKYNIVIYKL